MELEARQGVGGRPGVSCPVRFRLRRPDSGCNGSCRNFGLTGARRMVERPKSDHNWHSSEEKLTPLVRI